MVHIALAKDCLYNATLVAEFYLCDQMALNDSGYWLLLSLHKQKLFRINQGPKQVFERLLAVGFHLLDVG